VLKRVKIWRWGWKLKEEN